LGGNEAERLGKRTLPIVIQDVEPTLIPGRIKRFNYIFIRNADEQASGLVKLVGAVQTDINWIRTHTRLGELAADWDRGKRTTEFLLRGTTLLSAESWIADLPPAGSAPTLLQREYIRASRAEALAQAVRVGRAQVLLGFLIVALLSGAGYLVWLDRNYLRFQMNLILDTYMPTVLPASAERGLMEGHSFQECASCPQMVVLPAGEFLMGSPSGEGSDSERPQHSVRIEQAFAVAKFGVTFDQWDACIAHGGCTHHADDRGWGRGFIPVTDVSWNDAQEYINWLSKQTNRHYRLLSEAEREYAARGGSNTKYPWGNDLGKDNANCSTGGSEREDKQPTPVGSFPPNAIGLYDMIGNLWEWVEDNWHPDYEEAPHTGSVWAGGDSSQRVTRGGSYAITCGDCYTAFRDFARPPELRNYIFGIRVARSLNGL
jgi:formylglycine-generating enzyme required for sulfatase activity